MMDDTSNLESFETHMAELLALSPEDLRKSILQLSEEDVETLYAVAFSLHENGKYREASNFFRLLTNLDHAKKKHWIGLGACLQSLKSYEEAINAYTIAAILDQDDPHIHFYAAECCFSMGDRDRGIDALQCAETLAARDDTLKGLKKQLSTLREVWAAPTRYNEGKKNG